MEDILFRDENYILLFSNAHRHTRIYRREEREREKRETGIGFNGYRIKRSHVT